MMTMWPFRVNLALSLLPRRNNCGILHLNKSLENLFLNGIVSRSIDKLSKIRRPKGGKPS